MFNMCKQKSKTDAEFMRRTSSDARNQITSVDELLTRSMQKKYNIQSGSFVRYIYRTAEQLYKLPVNNNMPEWLKKHYLKKLTL